MNEDTVVELERLGKEKLALLKALRLLRTLIDENMGGVPRYTILPGAALNSVIEEVVDPLLKEFRDDG